MMGTLKFSIHMLKRETKKSLIYTLTLCLTIAVTYMFFNIIDNPYLVMSQALSSTKGMMDIPFSSVLSFIVISFCGFMIIFANNYYLSRKTKELAIMAMSGSGFIDMTLYLFYQNIIMTFVAFPIGILIGGVGAIGINQLIYQSIQTTGPLFYIPLSAIADTLICMVTIIGVQLLYASGYVHRKDISYMLSQESTSSLSDTRIIKLHPNFYLIIYLLGIVMLIGTEYTPSAALVSCGIGVLGIGGIIKYIFPNILKKLKNKKYISSYTYLISLSNLYYSLSRAILLIGLFAISSSVMIMVIIVQKNYPREFITAVIGFIVMTLLLLVSIIYKFTLEASSRQMSYYNLYKLGYCYHQLISIIKQEVFLFYSMLILLPFVYIGLSLGLSIIHQQISLEFMLGILISLFIPLIVVGILTYFLYKKSILKVIKEGVKYE